MSMRSPPNNQLLALLSRHDSETLRPHLRLVELTERAVLIEAGKPVERVYFPHSGIISLVANFSNGQSVDVAMIGRDSVFGASAALGGRISRTTAIVRLPGTASVLDAAHLHVADDESARLREFSCSTKRPCSRKSSSRPPATPSTACKLGYPDTCCACETFAATTRCTRRKNFWPRCSACSATACRSSPMHSARRS